MSALTLPAAQGTLYYRYDNGDYDSKVTSSKCYYRSGSPYLDQVTFVPARNFSGVVSIPFTGRGRMEGLLGPAGDRRGYWIGPHRVPGEAQQLCHL